jgi:hypothetical protein
MIVHLEMVPLEMIQSFKMSYGVALGLLIRDILRGTPLSYKAFGQIRIFLRQAFRGDTDLVTLLDESGLVKKISACHQSDLRSPDWVKDMI